MPSYLLSVGAAAGRSLPVFFTALSCGAVPSVPSLNVFSVSADRDGSTEAASLASSLSACRRLMAEAGDSVFFPTDIVFDSCVPVFRDLRSLSGDSETSLLFDALRGRGLPFSFRLDREAVEWCFADLLSRPEDASVLQLFSWLSGIVSSAEREKTVRLTLLADFSDPYASGIALALLPFLRDYFDKHSVAVFLSVLALAETSSPLPESFFPSLSSSLQAVDSRSLLRGPEDGPVAGADAMWLLSLPSSMVKNPDSHKITAMAAVRIFSNFLCTEKAAPTGFHTREIDGTLSLASLGDQLPSFASFLRTAVWMLSDLFPAARTYLSHPARFRSLTMNPRNGLFRRLFASARNPSADPLADLSVLESGFKALLDQILSFLRSIPDAFRPSAEFASLWQQAVNACGRYITVASELDTSAAEAKESGLDSVRPVHRISMADTEEEQLLRRLQDMNRQLEEEASVRNKILSSLGGYRSLQVRLDCCSRCTAALEDAREKAAAPEEGLDHLSLLKRDRRVRLLEAAVARCRDELDPASVQAAVSAPSAAGSSSDDPYAACPLNADACRALEKLSAAAPEDSVSQHIPPLFPGIPEPDPKTRIRTLAAMYRDDVPPHPVSWFTIQALSVCREELEGLTPALFLPDNPMPAVPLLPDIIVDAPLLTLRDVLDRLPCLSAPERETAERRGILAMLLLRQYRRRASSEAELSEVCCRTGDSPVLNYWLSAHHAENVRILFLGNEVISAPFALVLPGQAFLPARRTSGHAALIPSFVTWFDRESDMFLDPCGFLGEGDRLLLKELLSSYTSAPEIDPDSPLGSFLRSFLEDLSADPEIPAADENLKTRLRTVCGLRALSAYDPWLSVETCHYEHYLVSDLLGSCLTGREDFPASLCTEIPEDAVYLYREIPFAREDSRILLADPHAAGGDYTLSRLKTECDVLAGYSDDYRDALLKNLRELLDRTPSALPGAKETALALLKDASSPVDRREPVFVWPWDDKSPSILTVLRESLGAELSADAVRPFSEALAVFPARGNDVIGDTLLSAMCAVMPRQEGSSAPETPNPDLTPDAVLPPLSPAFGRSLCLLPEGRTLLKTGLLAFERFRGDKPGFTRDISDSFRVTLTLDGAFPVHLIRNYAPEEILHLYAHDIPTVALWPSIPFRSQDWHAYYVYAHLSEAWKLSVMSSAGEWTDLPMASQERVASVYDSFPVCFSLSSEGKTAGLLPNVLPEPLVESSDPVDICVDFGSAGTSVVFSSGRQRRPLHGPVMVRTLLNNPAVSRDLLRREFLPAVPVSALLPTVSRIFRNAPGAAPVPFVDGIVLMSSGLEDLLSTPSDAIYTSLKWEGEKGRSGFLCLHQIMLMAALQARYEGASAISWRFSLPDEMAKEGRESLMNLFLSLGESVLKESGYPLTGSDGGFPVSFASESSALGAYFRFCASDDTRGGFMVLDLGACTADISLFLRGREQAVRTCQIPLGIHYMLLPSLLHDPDLLSRDFGYCTDEAFRRDLSLLSRALSDARTDPVALRRARVSLDYFIADHLSLLLSMALQMASAGQPSGSGALILLYLSYLMMLSGLVLLQLAADPNRNDFLPEQMTLCISGRGAALLESLPQPLKTSLWHFLSMFRNRRVSSLSLLFSAEKKMEIPVGLSLLQEVYHMLPPASVIPASIAVRPSELLPEFLLRFRREFPVSAEMLFPGFFTNDLYHPFTDRGEALVSSSIDQSFPPTDTPRPYDSLSAWIGNLLELIRNN